MGFLFFVLAGSPFRPCGWGPRGFNRLTFRRVAMLTGFTPGEIERQSMTMQNTTCHGERSRTMTSPKAPRHAESVEA